MPYAATTIDLCETTWNEQVVAGVVLSIDGADYKEGSNSTVMTMAAPLTAGTIIASEDISALTPDLSSCQRVRLWIKSSVATADGDLQLLLDAHANCASPEETLDIPALTAGVWAYVTIDLADPASDGAIISVGLKYTANPQAGAIKVDAVYGDALTPEFQKREIGRLSAQAISQFEEIMSRFAEFSVDSGTATGGSNTTCVDSGKSWATDILKGGYLEVHTAADGLSHFALISANTATTITMGALAGAVSVAAGDDYAIRLHVGIADMYKWGGTLLTGRDISGDLQALTDISITGILKSIGDISTSDSLIARLGALADAMVAAGGAGSMSAKLRRATQGLEDLKTMIVLAAGSAVIGKVGHNITAIWDGRRVVAAAGTRLTLVAASTPAKVVIITAETDNTDIVVVGGVTVVAALATRQGTPLNPGDTATLAVDNLIDVYLDSMVTGEGVTYTYLN